MMHFPLQHLAVNAFRLWDSSSDVCIHCQIGRWPSARSANDGRCREARRQCRNAEISWNIWMLICCVYRYLINISATICIQQSFRSWVFNLLENRGAVSTALQREAFANQQRRIVQEDAKGIRDPNKTMHLSCNIAQPGTISWCTCNITPFWNQKYHPFHSHLSSIYVFTLTPDFTMHLSAILAPRQLVVGLHLRSCANHTWIHKTWKSPSFRVLFLRHCLTF